MFFIVFLAHLLLSCTKEAGVVTKQQNSVISLQDRKELEKKSDLEQQKDGKIEEVSLIALANSSNFYDTIDKIEALGGVVAFSDQKTGYINFEISSTAALGLIDEGEFAALSIDKQILEDVKLEITKNPNGEVLNAISRSETPADLYPTHLMKVDELKKEFEQKYSTKLDGSNATIVIADTGLDISRTDAFQDRIVELHTLRQSDHALLFKADLVNNNGQEYYHIDYDLGNGQSIPIDIENSERLANAQEVYLGFFTEAQFRNERGYNNFDFNQDGKDNGIFPVVVFRNEGEPYKAYINVNTALMYGEKGDFSIEDENLLMDFNWVARNVKDRYVANKKNPLKSYYKYTTRTDIIDGDSLTTDRNKGVMNVAVTLGVGEELDDQGNLKPMTQVGGKDVYMMGLVGFDIMGHGTHCAGIAAGNFQTAKEFSSAAPKAKIIGISYLGARVSESAFFNLVFKISQTYRHPVFSFSFGGNTAINDTLNKSAQLFDKVAQVYNTVFVKAAGNEGPALNTHGITISKNMIAVANYYSTASRETYSYGNFADDLFLLETSSSRGPMIDGALKPDIGAPGWVMSSVPLAKPIGGQKNGSFQYWPGTSMATPNVAGVIALLLDAADKAELNSKEQETVTVDKVQRALWNSALPYSPLKGAECIAKQDGSLATKCNLKERNHLYQWIEGGAGRINALGAWKVLQQLLEEPAQYYTVRTKSPLNNFRGEAAGYFNIIKDEIPKKIDFKISLDTVNGFSEDLDSLAQHQKVRLQIPADVDWLSFEVERTTKERLVDIFGGEQAYVTLFVNRQKLMKNGRIKPGVHSAVIKAFGVDEKNVFKFVLPVTMVGYHTLFDPNLDNYQFSAKGFVQAGQFTSYFIPVLSENEAVVIDLGVDGTMPGDISMAVFYEGMQITHDPMWTLSNPLYGAGRNNTHFVLRGKPGLYEVVLKSDAGAHFKYKELMGSYYNLTVSRMVLDVAHVKKQEQGDMIKVTLEGVSNPGSTVRIAHAGVVVHKVRKASSVEVTHQQQVQIPVTLEADYKGLSVETAYLGDLPQVDIDIQLVDSNGQVVAQSGRPDCNEFMEAQLAPGDYTLVIFGYSVPGNEAVSISYTVNKVLEEPRYMSSSFDGPDKLSIAKDKRIYHNQEFDAQSVFSRYNYVNMKVNDEYTPVMEVEIAAQSSNHPGDATVIFSQEL